MKHFTFKSQIGIVTGTEHSKNGLQAYIDSIEVYDCEVDATFGPTGLRIDYVYVPSLGTGIVAELLAPVEHDRLGMEAFEELKPELFAPRHRC